MERLGTKIDELAEFIKDKRNLHHELRRMVRSIETAYRLASKKEAPSRAVSTTQTSPWMATQPKKVVTPTTGKTTQEKQNNKKRPLSTPSPNSTPDTRASKKPAKDAAWTEVTRRSRKKKAPGDPAATTGETRKLEAKDNSNLNNAHRKTKKRKPRTKAVLIQPTEGRTYADLLKEMKNKVNPSETGVDIKSIKQTKRGGVLVEMGPKTKNSTAFIDAVRLAMTNIGTVKTLAPTTTIKILDLDGISTEDDVRDALKREFTAGLEIKRVDLTKITPRGQRAAFCEIDDASATTALDKARIKIGWINCRIRTVAKVTRCPRCLGYGHQMRSCKGPDRRKCCYKCGGENHKAVDCSEQPKCFLCTADTDAKDGLCHISGSGACKAFRAALAAATRTQK